MTTRRRTAMTKPARIIQDDMSRAMKAVAAAGLNRARIVMNLQAQTIEIILGESANDTANLEEWTDDDV